MKIGLYSGNTGRRLKNIILGRKDTTPYSNIKKIILFSYNIRYIFEMKAKSPRFLNYICIYYLF